jgi:Fe-S oxidoreductase
MNIYKYTDAIKNCRFCFMCRHLSAIGNVTFTEADTPRVRASMIYGVTMYPERIADKDFIDTLYRSDLSRCCCFHCVNHYDENALNIAMRTDIVEKGFAPDYVKAIAAELKESAAWEISGKSDVLYFIDRYTAEAASVVPAFDAVMKKAQVSYATISGGCIGRALKVLGFADDAKISAEKFVAEVKAAGAKTLVVSNPAACELLKHDCAEFGIEVPFKVMHTTEYIQSLNLNFSKNAGALYYLESDYLRNYDNDTVSPGALLAALKADIKPFGTNNEESYSCGEGAVVLPKIDENLVRKLAEYVAERADDPANDLIVTASPYTKIFLSKYTSLKVVTMEELAAAAL